MPIIIEKPANIAPMALPAKTWPWLLSSALHGLLLLLLLGMAAGTDSFEQVMQVTLLAPGSMETAANLPTPAVAEPHAPLNKAPLARANNYSKTVARPNNVNSPVVSVPQPANASLPAATLISSDKLGSHNTLARQAIGPYELSQVDIQPRLLTRIEPVYPQLARRRHIEGWVEVKFLVNEQGQVSQERVLKAQPAGIFENSALDALRGWHFAPAMLQGKNVDTWVVQIMRFRLTAS